MKAWDTADPVLVRYRQRELRASDVATIQRTIEAHPEPNRIGIARQLCALWEWRHPRGELKLGACQDLLRHLHRQGLIELPARGRGGGRRRPRTPLSEHPLPVYPLPMERADLRTLVVRVITREEWLGWEILVDRFHYLGHRPIVGEHLRYAAYVEDEIVACLAFASAALRCPARDRFIGWSDAARRQNLPGVVSNVRFLILPWVRVPHLASKILATCLRRLDADWRTSWGHGLFLAETFVDSARFRGTCYRASNWIYVGQSEGRSKRGNQYELHGQPKQVWLYPLHRRWREIAQASGPEP